MKIAPPQLKEPQRYAKNAEYFFGASTRDHTYCPPASGIADESSPRVMAMQTEKKVTMRIPYTINNGPPDWMPVTKPAEIPYQELVKVKPIAITEKVEKVLFNSPDLIDDVS